jgi:hypothetical protein
MLRRSGGLIGERIRAGGALRIALFGLLAALIAATVTGLAAAQAEAIFRAFSPNSPWNRTAVPTAATNPYAAQFTDRPGTPLRLSGTPDNLTYAAPVYWAQKGDPTAPVAVSQRDWLPDGETRWDGRKVPVPIGVRPAPGTDGHLTVVSADRKTAWEFLGCTQAGQMGYATRVIVQWNLNGPGYSQEDNATSARGSGTPLISTSLRAEEALSGIQHAVGFTVPRVSYDYTFPATHSDGKQGPSAIKYGMRFVLRPDYPVPTNASVGVINLTYALKVYGAYLVDQGADFELDADFTHPDLWQQAGLSSKTLDIQAGDFLPATFGTPGPIPTIVSPMTRSNRSPSVRLRGNKRPLRVGSRLHLSGRVRGDLFGHEQIRIEAFTRGQWRFMLAGKVGPGGLFTVRTRLRRSTRRFPARRRAEVLLRHLHLSAGRRLSLRAAVRGIDSSNVVRIRLAG